MRVLGLLFLFAALPVAAGCSGNGDEAEGSVAQSAAPRSLLDKERQSTETPLQVDRQSYDLGSIPIDGGNVEAAFEVWNEGSSPVRLAAVYTSCGCTTAVLEFADGSTAGPFGMPGHDLETTLDRTVDAGEKFNINVIYDPMAHGPDATGKYMRTVTIHTQDGGGIEVAITVNVVKA